MNEIKLTYLLSILTNVTFVNANEFSLVFDYSDFIGSLNNGNINVYQNGDCIGIMEEFYNKTKYCIMFVKEV